MVHNHIVNKQEEFGKRGNLIRDSELNKLKHFFSLVFSGKIICTKTITTKLEGLV